MSTTYITVNEVAAIVGIPTSVLQGWCDSGDIQGSRKGLGDYQMIPTDTIPLIKEKAQVYHLQASRGTRKPLKNLKLRDHSVIEALVDNGARCCLCGGIVYNTPKRHSSVQWQCKTCGAASSRQNQSAMKRAEQQIIAKVKWTHRAAH